MHQDHNRYSGILPPADAPEVFATHTVLLQAVTRDDR